MVRKLTYSLLLGGSLSIAGAAHAALVITTSTDAALLANALIAPGSGLTISNPTLTGATNQQGTFTGGVSAGIGIESGVILTSGNATFAPGPNISDSRTANLNTSGDASLNALVAPNTTHDANVLQFDFTTTTGNLFFNYAFASEEYNEFVNSSFNDVFAFFVDGVNIALIPGTSTPVAINTVNCNNPYNPPTGSHCELFINNDPSDSGPSGPAFNVEYDGFTQVLTATATGLDVAATHHIKLAIADTSDTQLDSAVFLQGQSFVAQQPTPGLPEPGSLALLSAALLGLAAVRRRRI